MRIVVLDGFTLNPGDLSWDSLKLLGECTVYDRTSEDKILSRVQEAEIILTNKVPIRRFTIETLPRLKYIGVMATGYNIVDVVAARQAGITVTNVPNYGTDAVAQMTFALLLELTNNVGHHSQAVHNGRWAASPDFCFWDFPTGELAGRTMGIIGLGRIGQAVARIAQAFGMKVVAPRRDSSTPAPAGIDLVELNDLFKIADVISLHCPLTPETREMVNTERLSSMKRSALLLNTSRGPLVDENALARALREGMIAGAGLDVLSVEPPAENNPLMEVPHCIITPHIAWAAFEARKRLLAMTTQNIRAYLEGLPQNVVS